MIIKDTIQKMLDELPDPIPDLLNADQAAIVQSCIISLKDAARQRMWKMLMKMTHITTINGGSKNMHEYVESLDDYDCMASAAKDLKSFKEKLVMG